VGASAFLVDRGVIFLYLCACKRLVLPSHSKRAVFVLVRRLRTTCLDQWRALRLVCPSVCFRPGAPLRPLGQIAQPLEGTCRQHLLVEAPAPIPTSATRYVHSTSNTQVKNIL